MVPSIAPRRRASRALARPRPLDLVALEPLEQRQVLAAPEVTGFGATLSMVAPGDQVTLLGTATDESGIRAMSFFLDRNSNGRFDNGTDQPLADVFTPDQWGRYALGLVANESWGPAPAFGCNAVDNTGVWGVTPGKLAINIAPRWEITELSGYQDTTIDWSFRAKLGRAHLEGAIETNVVGVTFFQDKNLNGRWDGPSIDTDFGFVQTPDPYTGEYVLHKMMYPWTGPRRIVAAVLDDRAIGNGWGTPRSGAVRTAWGSWNMPRVTELQVQTVNPPQVPGAVVNGEVFKIAGYIEGYQMRAATCYYDKNANGLWDSGIDTDLGARFYTGDNYGVAFEVTVARDQLFAAGGFQRIAVAGRYQSDTDDWGPSRTSIIRVIDPPKINSPSTSVASVPRGQSFFLEFNAPDDFGTRTVSGFLDRNNNGLYDAGIDIVATNAVRIQGDTRNGRWRVTLSTLVINTPGTYRLYMAGVDFEGAWARRGTTIIQVT
jgi:hypothetical protein